MADVKTVAIRLVAYSEDFKKAMREGEAATNQFSNAVGAGLAVAGAALAAFAVKSADSYVEYGKSIMGLSRVSGENIETSSKMNFAAEQSGVTTEKLTAGIKYMESNMVAGSAAFTKLGVSVKTTDGHFRSSHAVLLDTADAISKMHNGAEKTALILQIFGRGGLEMGKLLNQGAAGIALLEQQAEKYGLVLKTDNVAAIQANIKAHRQMDAAMQGLQIRIGQEVLPVMTTLTETLAKIPGPLMSIGPPVIAGVAALGTMVVVASKLKNAYNNLGESIPKLGTGVAASAVAIGGAIAVYEIWNTRMQNAYRAADELERVVAAGNQSGTFDSMAARVGKIDAAIADLSNEINNSSAPWDADYRAEMDAYREKLIQASGATAAQRDAIDLVSIATGDSKEKVKGFADEQAKSGHIYKTGADLLAAYRGQVVLTGDDSGDATEKTTAFKDAIAAQNKAQNEALQPQFAMIDAQKQLRDAQQGVVQAERGVEDAHRAVADAQDNVIRAEQRRADAARQLTDAVRSQSEAQQELNDLLRGPSVDEQINLESAQISLEEARRRAAGLTGTDPGLERRRNALDLRRAEIGVQQAEGAHARNVVNAQRNVEQANEGVASARQGVIDASKGVDDANRALRDSSDKVSIAEQGVADAHVNVFKAAIGVEQAARTLIGAYVAHDTAAQDTADMLQTLHDNGSITADEMNRLGWSMVFAKVAADNLAKSPTGETLGAPSTGEANRQATGENAPYWETPSAVPAWKPGDPISLWAGGGELNEGWNMIGEQGPELTFKRGGRVQVVSNPNTRGMLTPHPPGITATAAGSTGNGGYTHNGDIIIGTATQRTPGDIIHAQRLLALQLAGS